MNKFIKHFVVGSVILCFIVLWNIAIYKHSVDKFEKNLDETKTAFEEVTATTTEQTTLPEIQTESTTEELEPLGKVREAYAVVNKEVLTEATTEQVEATTEVSTEEKRVTNCFPRVDTNNDDTFSYVQDGETITATINGVDYSFYTAILYDAIDFPPIGSQFAKITIPSIGLYDTDIVVGATQDLVDTFDICMSTRDSYFGDKRPALLCGHNDRSFQKLFDLKLNSYIFVEAKYGGWVYKVTDIKYGTINDEYTDILDSDGNSLLVENIEYDNQYLQMYTCYGETTGTKERIVITAEQVVGTEVYK